MSQSMKMVCAVCGGDVGLFGITRLADGLLCRECTAGLSPWFRSAGALSTDTAAKHLEYRDMNREKVAAFHATRVIGNNAKVLLDEDKGVFVVTGENDPTGVALQETNPDVVSIADVIGLRVNIGEKFANSYTVKAIIEVKSPFFTEIAVDLGEGVDIIGNPRENESVQTLLRQGEELRSAFGLENDREVS